MSDSETPWTIQSMEFSRPEYWSELLFPSPGDLPNPVIKPRSPALQADSFLAELQRKPNNTGIGSPSLLQQIFPTRESNRDLPHCGQILYHLRLQESPESACNVGNLGSVPGLGRPSGEGKGYPLQYSYLENSMNRGAWWATVHGVTKSWTWLSDCELQR